MGSLVNSTSYSNPNVNVSTSGPGIGGLGGLNVDPFFLNMAKRRAELAAQRAAMENLAMKNSLRPQYRSDADPTQLQRAQEADAMDELSHKHQLRQADLNANGQNLKMRQGFNITPGYASDTELLPISMRPANAGMATADINTAHLPPGGTGGFDPVAAEKAASADLNAPGGNSAPGSFDTSLIEGRAKTDLIEEAEKKRQQAEAQARYFSGRG